MLDGRIIPDRKRLELPRIMRQLGFTQLEVAKAIGLSPASISRYLSTGNDRIDLRSDHVQNLLDVLKRRSAEIRNIKSLSLDQRDGQREFATSALRAARVISTQVVITLQAEIEELATIVPNTTAFASSEVIVMPSGALPIQAINYVRRSADDAIEDLLKFGRSPSTIVVAPVNGGTSSFLNRVYDRAREMPHSWVSIVHFETEFTQSDKFTQLDLFRYLFRRVGISDDLFEAGRSDVHEMKIAFDSWARTAWQDRAPVVLIVDGLDEVFKNAGSLADPLPLLNWFSALRNEAALGRPPYSKLALFTSLTGRTWSAAHASPYASQAGELRLNKFTADQVTQLFTQFSIGLASYSQPAVLELFHGHPYLTHLFAWSLHVGQRAEEATQSALALEGRYETHWERMKTEIRFLIGSNFRLEEILTAIVGVIEGHYDDDAYRIWRSYRRDLRVFGLVDGTPDQPTMCKFYLNAVHKELKGSGNIVARHTEGKLRG
jgi:predicted transcriptional regulator